MKTVLRGLWRRKPWLRRLSLAGLFTGSLLVALAGMFLTWTAELESRGFGWMEVTSLTGINPRVMAALKSNPLVREAWPMESAQFEVRASLGFGETQYSTELFLEAVDSRAADFSQEGWVWKPGQQVLPLVISRTFLGLYNLGFAPARGLPPLYPSTLDTIPLTFEFSGQGEKWVIPGRIVGLTDRFSTVLVPWDFLQEGNRKLAGSPGGKIRRAALGVSDPGDPGLMPFLRGLDLEVYGGSGRSSDYVQLAQGFVAALGGLGLLVLALALGLAAASLELLRQQGSRELGILEQFGAEPGKIARILRGWFFTSLGLLAFLWVLGTLGLLMVFRPLTESLGLGYSGWWAAFSGGLAVWVLGALAVHLTLVRGFSPGSSLRS